jgi:hypothetical protein
MGGAIGATLDTGRAMLLNLDTTRMDLSDRPSVQ